MTEIELRNQICNLCDSLHRNINDNFLNVSFDILENGDIQTKIILTKLTASEEEYIEDISAEFTSKQERDCVLKPIIEIGVDKRPLKNIVYNTT